MLIDEWQEAEVVFDYVRRRADEATINGEYILTGSATPNFLSNRKKHQHSGAGRIKQITMSTLTYYEIFKPSETISISKIDSFTPGLKSDLSLEDLIKFCIKGGWPRNQNLEWDDSRFLIEGYIDSIVNDDLIKFQNIRITAEIIRKILQTFFRNISTISEEQTLYLDTINTLSRSFSLQTFKTYLNVLKSKYLIDEIPAWKPNIRSKTRIRSTSKKIFVDQSLGCAAAKMTIDKFINDLRLFGFVFENLVFHDLKVYSEIDN